MQHWTDQLDTREREQIAHAIAYSKEHAASGTPGHSLFLLIAKLARILDERGAK